MRLGGARHQVDCAVLQPLVATVEPRNNRSLLVEAQEPGRATQLLPKMSLKARLHVRNVDDYIGISVRRIRQVCNDRERCLLDMEPYLIAGQNRRHLVSEPVRLPFVEVLKDLTDLTTTKQLLFITKQEIDQRLRAGNPLPSEGVIEEGLVKERDAV